jgi:hypothetical protein
MNTSEAKFRVNVDPLNPGQFFACCGLLELADRLWPGAEGWFTEAAFHVECTGTLPGLIQMLLACEPEEVLILANGLPVKPLIAPLKFRFSVDPRVEFTLDAWMTVRTEKEVVVATKNPPWNFWSGQQTSYRIWRDLRSALEIQIPTIPEDELSDLFNRRIFLSGRFGFDPGAAWNALDVGFSPNEHGFEVASSAAVEMLAAVGIQRFRPLPSPKRDRFMYSTWQHRMAPQIASAAASTLLDCSILQSYEGRVVSRGSYAALGRSVPISGGNR